MSNRIKNIVINDNDKPASSFTSESRHKDESTIFLDDDVYEWRDTEMDFRLVTINRNDKNEKYFIVKDKSDENSNTLINKNNAKFNLRKPMTIFNNNKNINDNNKTNSINNSINNNINNNNYNYINDINNKIISNNINNINNINNNNFNNNGNNNINYDINKENTCNSEIKEICPNNNNNIIDDDYNNSDDEPVPIPYNISMNRIQHPNHFNTPNGNCFQLQDQNPMIRTQQNELNFRNYEDNYVQDQHYKSKTVNQNSSTAKFDTSKFENYDLSNIAYNFASNYAKVHIDIDKNFLERMQFDIYKRQFKEERMRQLLYEKMNKLDEEERLRGFNHLIQDANRRMEVQENLENIEKKLNDNVVLVPNKKYTEKEWNEIYEKRFKVYVDEKKKKLEEYRKTKENNEKMKENEVVQMCLNKKKKNIKEIEVASQRLYEDAKIRKLRNEERRNRIKKNMDDEIYGDNRINTKNDNENDTMNYVKIIRGATYKFNDDNNFNNNYNNYNNNNYNNNIYNNYNNNYNYYNNNNNLKNVKYNSYADHPYSKKKCRNNLNSKPKNMAVTEFNNKRFERFKNKNFNFNNTNINNNLLPEDLKSFSKENENGNLFEGDDYSEEKILSNMLDDNANKHGNSKNNSRINNRNNKLNNLFNNSFDFKNKYNLEEEKIKLLEMAAKRRINPSSDDQQLYNYSKNVDNKILNNISNNSNQNNNSQNNSNNNNNDLNNGNLNLKSENNNKHFHKIEPNLCKSCVIPNDNKYTKPIIKNDGRCILNPREYLKRINNNQLKSKANTNNNQIPNKETAEILEQFFINQLDTNK